MTGNNTPFEFEFNVDQDLQLDLILERIADYSDEIEEFVEEDYFKQRWLQVLGEENTDSILHLFFEENDEYLYSLNGDIHFRGKWRILKDSDAFIIEKVVSNQVTKSELFDLAFLNENFFILKKHGDQSSKGKAKYLFLAREDLIEDLEYEEIMTLLRKEGQSSSRPSVYLLGFLILIILVLLKYFEVF